MGMAVEQISQAQECVLSGVGAVVLQLGYELCKGDIACVCEERCLVMADRLARKGDC